MRAPLAKAGLALLFPAVAFLFLGDLFVGGRILLARDALADSVPMRLFEAHSLRAGEFPFWCPFFGPGKPFFADTTASAYPATLLYALLSPATALRLDWLLHIAIAGTAFYFLVRQFCFTRTAAVTCAIGFMLSTWMFVRAEFLPAFEAAAWIPLPLALVVRFDRRLTSGATILRELGREWPLVAALTAVFVISFLANYPEFILYPLVATALFIAGTGKRAWRNAIFLGVAGGLALVIVSPQLGPMLEFLPFTERAGAFDARFDMASFGLPHLTTLVFPFIGGRPGYPDMLWARGVYEYWAIACFVGVLPLWAAPYALLSVFETSESATDRVRRRAVLLGIGLVGFGLLLSAGANLPLYGWLFEYVPGMDRFRYPSKFLVLVVIGALLLAAGGLDAVLERNRYSLGQRRRMNAIFIGQLALTTVLAGGVVYALQQPSVIGELFGAGGQIPPSRFSEAARQLAFDGLFMLAAVGLIAMARYGRTSLIRALAVALPAFVFVNLTFVSRQLYPTAADSMLELNTPVANAAVIGDPSFRAHSDYASAQRFAYGSADASLFRWSREAGVGSAWIADGINQLWQGSLKLEKYLRLLAAMAQSPQSDAVADLLSVRWVVTGPSDAKAIFLNGASREYRIVERPTAIPRVRLVGRWTEWVVSSEAAVDRLASSPPAPDSAFVEPVALLGGQPVASRVPATEGNHPVGRIGTPRFAVNRIAVHTQAEATNLLVVGDTWYPGWTARVDGNEEPVFRVNALFRGVFVPAGVHTVELTYRPRWLGPLFALSVSGLLIVGVPLVPRIQRAIRRSRRRSNDEGTTAAPPGAAARAAPPRGRRRGRGRAR
jgi:hypothetical protein